jgi:hypothetical protein
MSLMYMSSKGRVTSMLKTSVNDLDGGLAPELGVLGNTEETLGAWNRWRIVGIRDICAFDCLTSGNSGAFMSSAHQYIKRA